MLFRMKYYTEDNINVPFGEELVSRVFVTKFVGVLIKEHLKWKYHIRMIKSKLSKKIMYYISS